ncbi:hypothetical protein V1508DRAFT_428769 [Lipomyces doorenjongii]|uniref:uncharacterized protein n=1 Tax=Lipomyces doorenjongii TaxID=383834 RepID=UPI0034CF6A81
MDRERQRRGTNTIALTRHETDPSPGRAIRRDEADEEAPKFVFVNSNITGTSTAANKRLIHQHAMKEIGRSRRRPKRNPTIDLDFVVLEPWERSPPRSPWLGCLSVGSSALDPFLRFPLELDGTARQLVAYIFDDEHGQQRPLRDAWFTVGLQDEATFSQVLANSALHMEIMRRGRDGVRETPDSILYYNWAIASIRRRFGMAKRETLDYTIGTVTGMLAHADILGNDNDWITHHKGLQELVRVRGGIELLESNEALRLTISWCELRGVYLLDLKPKFPLPRQWVRFSTPLLSSDSDPEALEYTARVRRMWSQGGLDGSEWHSMYRDLVSFSLRSFKGHPSVSQLAKMPSDFGAWSNPMIHRLLSWRPAEGSVSRDTLVQETCRLGALLYLVPVWRFFGVSPVYSRVLRKQLKIVITNHDVDWSHVWVAKLWSLYMSSVEALDSADEDWYTNAIVEVLVDHGIKDWNKGREQIKDMLWFDCLFVGRDDRLATKVRTILSEQ